MRHAIFIILAILSLSSLTSFAQEQKPDLSVAEWKYIQSLDKGDTPGNGFEVTGNTNGMRFQLTFEHGGEKYFSFVVIKERVITAHLFFQNGSGQRGNPVSGVHPDIQEFVKDLVKKMIKDNQ
ncbi:MAG: hypothetical protein KKA84_07950 [Bacteroidetes bacterium]|nr:hypothetical protein [Bacteroidota bacterium]